MDIIICLAVAIIALGAMYSVEYFRRREAKRMTYDKLIEECKQLIDDGKYDKMQSKLLRHPKILLQHFNDLQTALTEYARVVDARNAEKSNKEV